MYDTKFLAYILEELKKSGVVWNNNKEIFEILLPNCSWQKYRKSWYHWIKQDVKSLRKSKAIKEAIAKRLYFDYSVWGNSDKVQIEAVKKGIEIFNSSNKQIIDLSNLMPKESPMSQAQKEIFAKVQTMPLQDIKDTLLKNPKELQKKLENQTFILNLIELLYSRGCYDTLEELLLPKLLAHHRTQKEIKIIEAHTIGSLKNPRYKEAILLLNSIKTKDNDELIDIKTAIVSNIRRNMLQDKNLTKEDLQNILKISIEQYLKLYKKSYHYYPAVNLLYVVKLYSLIFKQNLVDKNLLKEIPKNSMPSIIKERKRKDIATKYYAKVSKLEIKMLLSNMPTQEFELLLEELNPSIDLMQRTLRQIEFFINTVNNFAPKKAKEEIKYITDIAQVFKDKIDLDIL